MIVADRYLTCEDPNGHSTANVRDAIRDLANRNVDLHFFHLMEITQKMEAFLDSLLRVYNSKLFVSQLDSNVEQFLPHIVQSINSSVMRSNWG